MIVLVSVGTDCHPFGRLVEWVERWHAEQQGVGLLVQYGSSCPPTRAAAQDYFDHGELQRAIRESGLVVCHGGPATITEARRNGRLPIVVPRESGRGEHIDDHQLRFGRRLDHAGLVACCETEQLLHATLDRALAEPDGFRLRTRHEMAGENAAPTESVRKTGELVDLLVAGRRRVLSAQPPSPSSPSPSPSVRSSTPDSAWPSVSVVVPTRDRPELLRKTLNSLLAQDYPGDIRCVVVFDGTDPDDSLVIDDSHRGVKVVNNIRAGGLSGARNSGILHADGDLVAFCDDDDTWLPSKLRAQVQALRDHPEALVVTCGIRIDHDGALADRTLPSRHIGFGDLLRSRLAELHPSTFLIRRDALLADIGLVNEELPGSYAEDYEWLLRAARGAPLLNLPEVHVSVLWHPRSYFSSRWATIASALTWLLGAYPEFRLQPKGYARVAGQIAFAHAARAERRAASRWSARALRRNPREPRAYLAAAVAGHLVSADAILRMLHRRGRGL